MSKLRMSDVFELPISVKLKFTGDKSNELTPDVMMIDEHYTLNGTECQRVEMAVNNHDTMQDTITQLEADKSELLEALDVINQLSIADAGIESYLDDVVIDLINKHKSI